jgi:hypothetical protein
MTKETRTLIDLGDISGIELECHQCKTKVLYPLDGTHGEKIARKCPNPSCPAPDALFDGDTLPGADTDITSLAKALKTLTKARADLRVKVRFRVATLP